MSAAAHKLRKRMNRATMSTSLDCCCHGEVDEWREDGQEFVKARNMKHRCVAWRQKRAGVVAATGMEWEVGWCSMAAAAVCVRMLMSSCWLIQS